MNQTCLYRSRDSFRDTFLFLRSCSENIGQCSDAYKMHVQTYPSCNSLKSESGKDLCAVPMTGGSSWASIRRRSLSLYTTPRAYYITNNGNILGEFAKNVTCYLLLITKTARKGNCMFRASDNYLTSAYPIANR